GFRPVVIVSGNLLNELLPVVIVMPLTTKVKRYKGNPILQPTKSNGLKDVSEMLVFQIRSVSKDRLVERIGNIEPEELQRSIKTLNDVLTY
ncbi:MAG TPA: type II toxin-antitoxin system PemK/MazF family toxin, partial [Cyclobacteriaceae bacterium]|nr:type II toxin-antitoxin system PemK/MazF family toxin [Cyclobacteriaceae bacterium]